MTTLADRLRDEATALAAEAAGIRQLEQVLAAAESKILEYKDIQHKLLVKYEDEKVRRKRIIDSATQQIESINAEIESEIARQGPLEEELERKAAAFEEGNEVNRKLLEQIKATIAEREKANHGLILQRDELKRENERLAAQIKQFKEALLVVTTPDTGGPPSPFASPVRASRPTSTVPSTVDEGLDPAERARAAEAEAKLKEESLRRAQANVAQESAQATPPPVTATGSSGGIELDIGSAEGDDDDLGILDE